jgi:hypothetical protein
MNFKKDIEEECPICMDVVEGLNNRVTTDCGHTFHCSCLMQNAAHNGFGCPYCRTMMAEEPKDEDEDEDEDEDDDWMTDDESDADEDNALTSFRMFHQHLAGEEIEESESDSDSETEQQEELEEGEILEDDQEEEEDRMPDSAYMTQKLIERNITMEDLVKHILWDSQTNFFGEDYNEYRGRSNEVYGQFRAIISRFRRSDTMRETIRGIREPIRETIRESIREEEVNV